MFYDLEEHPLFWASLEELDQLSDAERIGSAVSILAGWAVRTPLGAPPITEGIRVIKLPRIYIDGRLTPALRLAFLLNETPQPDGAAGVVTLLHVEAYDEKDELFNHADELLYPAGKVSEATGKNLNQMDEAASKAEERPPDKSMPPHRGRGASPPAAIITDAIARALSFDELQSDPLRSEGPKRFRVYLGDNTTSSTVDSYRAFTAALSDIVTKLSDFVSSAREYRYLLRDHEDWARSFMRSS